MPENYYSPFFVKLSSLNNSDLLKFWINYTTFNEGKEIKIFSDPDGKNPINYIRKLYVPEYDDKNKTEFFPVKHEFTY